MNPIAERPGSSPGILSILGGVFWLVQAITILIMVAGDFEAWPLLLGLVYGTLPPALLTGGIMLLRRKNAGRPTVIAACVWSIVVTCATVFVMGVLIVALLSVLFAVATLTLAAVGPTEHWVDAASAPGPTSMGGGPRTATTALVGRRRWRLLVADRPYRFVGDPGR